LSTPSNDSFQNSLLIKTHIVLPPLQNSVPVSQRSRNPTEEHAIDKKISSRGKPLEKSHRSLKNDIQRVLSHRSSQLNDDANRLSKRSGGLLKQLSIDQIDQSEEMKESKSEELPVVISEDALPNRDSLIN